MPVDITRLTALTEAGDRAAASQLEHEATRRGDRRLAALAAAAQGRHRALASDASALWARGDSARLEATSQLFGAVLDEEARARVEALLDRAQRRCQVRRISAQHILEALSMARWSPIGVGYASGNIEGEVEVSTRARTSLCVAVRHGEAVVVGVTRCSAKSTDPGTGWRELRPWQRPLARNAERCARWAAEADDDRVTLIAMATTAKLKDPAPSSPAAKLDALLTTLTRDRKGFREIQRFLRKHKSRAALCEQATLGLNAWPDATRLAMKPWIKRVLAERQPQLNALSRHLEVKGLGADDATHDQLRALANHSELSSLTTVTIESCEPTEAAAALLRSPHLTSLKHLNLRTLTTPSPCFEALKSLATPLESLEVSGYGAYPQEVPWEALTHLRALRSLRLYMPRQAHTMAGAVRELRSLRALYVEWWSTQASAIQTLLQNKRSLRTLALELVHLGQGAGGTELGLGRRLAKASLPSLEHLRCARCDLGQQDLKWLFGSSNVRGLRSLELTGTTLHAASILAMQRADMVHLTELNVGYSDLNASRLEALLDGPMAGRLETLNLSRNALGDKGARLLAEAPALRKLKTLILNDCRIGAAGRDALLASSYIRASIQGVG